MTKQELEYAIQNEESVWIINDNRVIKKQASSLRIFGDIFIVSNEYPTSIKSIFKTQKQAQHYLFHSNIERTEKLPFVTWEEAKKNSLHLYPVLKFDDYKLFVDLTGNFIGIDFGEHEIQYWGEATEENFYKAYDECVKLFKGEE